MKFLPIKGLITDSTQIVEGPLEDMTSLSNYLIIIHILNCYGKADNLLNPKQNLCSSVSRISNTFRKQNRIVNFVCHFQRKKIKRPQTKMRFNLIIFAFKQMPLGFWIQVAKITNFFKISSR